MTVSVDPIDTPIGSNESIITEKVEEVNKDLWAANLVDLNLGNAKVAAATKVTTGPSLSSMMGSNATTSTSSQPIMLNNSQPIMLNPTSLPPRPMMNAPPQQPMGMAAFTNPYENMQFPPRPMMNAPPQQPIGMAAFNNPYNSMNGPMPGMMNAPLQQPMGMAAFNSPQSNLMNGPMGPIGQGMMGGPGMMTNMNQARPSMTSTMPAAIRPVDPFTNLNLPIKSSSSSSSSSTAPYQSKQIQNSLDLLDLGLKK